MNMRFQFEHDKALQMMAYIVKRLNSVEKVKLMKLLYLADKQHFLQFGYPITGDEPYAMPYGPVPSATLDLLDGQTAPDTTYQYLHIDDVFVMLRHDPGDALLSDDERSTLDSILEKYGASDTWRLVNMTHELPEYVEAKNAAKEKGIRSFPISYESILKHAADEDHYRLGRPVISANSATHILCPFDANLDTDL